MKVTTELEARYGKARVIIRYNKETGEYIDRKVYDADHHVVLTTRDYKKANDMLMYGDIKRR